MEGRFVYLLLFFGVLEFLCPVFLKTSGNKKVKGNIGMPLGQMIIHKMFVWVTQTEPTYNIFNSDHTRCKIKYIEQDICSQILMCLKITFGPCKI